MWKMTCGSWPMASEHPNSENPPPPGKPFRDAAVCLKRRQRRPAKSPFTVDEHALVVAEVAELVGFDLVLLGFVVVHVAFTRAESPGAFDDALFAKKVGGLNCVAFIGSTEHHAVAEIQ